MIADKSVLAIIPARGGSKGVQRKNIREVAGKPLIAWSILAAQNSRYIDRLIISSEDAEIISVARSCGCEAPFVRPVELALDDTPGIAPVLHAIGALAEKYDFVVLLQPTSPLRTSEDIDGCLEQCVNQGAQSCVSVTIPEKSPYWMYKIGPDSQLQPLLVAEKTYLRRQDIPPVYALNGAVYIAEVEWLKKTKSFLTDETLGYVMPASRSLDIDTEADLFLASYTLGIK